MFSLFSIFILTCLQENLGCIGVPVINQSRKCCDSVLFNMSLSYSAFAEPLNFVVLRATNLFEAEEYGILFFLFISIYFVKDPFLSSVD